MRAVLVASALAACGGRDPAPASPELRMPRLQLIRCAPATPAPVIADDGVTFGGLTKADVMELKRSSRLGPSVARGPRLEITSPGAGEQVKLGSAEVRALRGCFERAVASNAKTPARVLVAFSIELDGRVANVSIAGATPELGRCLSDVLAPMTFPVPARGAALRVSQTLAFTPGAPGVPPGPSPWLQTSPDPAPPPSSPWIPFAVDGSPALEVASSVARMAETSLRARLDRIAACFPGHAPTGSFRTMLDLDNSGELVGVRIGGLGDATSESCVRRALAGLRVMAPSQDVVEVACDLSRGDAFRWRVTPEAYEVITASRAGLDYSGTKVAVGASEPDPLPSNRTYLVVAERDTPGTVLELALAWAFDGEATLIAERAPDGGAPLLVGVGRSTYALGDAHDPPGAVGIALQLTRDRLGACVESWRDDVAHADAKAVRALLDRVNAMCRKVTCASTVGLAIDGDAQTGSIAGIVESLRRAGFGRVLIGGGIGCHVAE